MSYKFCFSTLVFIFISFSSYTQNVGIGTNNPSEKLDVNGNINLTGIVKINSSGGAPGQVLMRGDGTSMTWGDPSLCGQFKHNYVATSLGGPISFTVPGNDSVNYVLVELWGAGGAGTQTTATIHYCYDPNGTGACDGVAPYYIQFGSGGGGGGYLRALCKVSGGYIFHGTVGVGGSSPGQKGDSTTLFAGHHKLVAQGGYGGDTVNSNFYYTNARQGGGYAIQRVTSRTDSVLQYWTGEFGKDGAITNNYNHDADFGKGGDPGNTVNPGGTGGFFDVNGTYVNGTVTSITMNGMGSTASKQPGGGGASNPNTSTLVGAAGRVIFWY